MRSIRGKTYAAPTFGLGGDCVQVWGSDGGTLIQDCIFDLSAVPLADQDEAMFVIFTECGEASQEVAKRGPCWEQNFEYELIDVMATCKRALLGDHKHIYGKSPDEQIKRW